jgi:hypothetical protein
MNPPSGIGGLLTTEVESVDLGEVDGVQLEGRVERRVLQIGVGGRRGLRFEIARLRPTAVQSTSATGVMVHRLGPNPDPWFETAQRLVALTVATALLPWLLRRMGSARR